MATSILLEGQVEIPYFPSLTEFRVWATSDDFPEKVRVDYISGRIEVDMSPEEVIVHGTVKTAIVGELYSITRRTRSGYLCSDCTRVSCPEADLSVEPDVVYVSHESVESGRVRLVARAAGGSDRYVEIEGPPDLVVEIVSDGSVAKDTRRLPVSYWHAGVAEYWLVDARKKQLLFQIYHRGAGHDTGSVVDVEDAEGVVSGGWQAAPADAEGFQRSCVFPLAFHLDRERDRLGHWAFELQSRPHG